MISNGKEVEKCWHLTVWRQRGDTRFYAIHLGKSSQGFFRYGQVTALKIQEYDEEKFLGKS
jgi:hypothetical protein